MKHELIVKVEPLGPPKRKTEKPADLDDVWYPVPGKPDFEVNGRGQMRTKVDLPPAAPAPVYSFVTDGEPIRLYYSTGQELHALGPWMRDLVPAREAAHDTYWGRSIPAMLGDAVADAAVTVAPPTTGSGLQLLLNADRVREQRCRQVADGLWGYWSADVVNRILKELLDDPVIKVV